MHSLPLLVLSVLVVIPATKPEDDIGFAAHLAFHDKPEDDRQPSGPEFDLANLPPFLRRMLLEKKANSEENAAHLNVDEAEETDKMRNEDDWMNAALDAFFSMAETPDGAQKKTVWDGSDEDDFEQMRQYYARKDAKKALDSRDAKTTAIPVPATSTATPTAPKEALIKLCGAPLLRYIIDRDLCRPDRCEGVTRPPVLAGWQSRSPSIKQQTALISEQCCHNHCPPSLIRAICCEQ